MSKTWKPVLNSWEHLSLSCSKPIYQEQLGALETAAKAAHCNYSTKSSQYVFGGGKGKLITSLLFSFTWLFYKFDVKTKQSLLSFELKVYFLGFAGQQVQLMIQRPTTC